MTPGKGWLCTTPACDREAGVDLNHASQQVGSQRGSDRVEPSQSILQGADTARVAKRVVAKQ